MLMEKYDIKEATAKNIINQAVKDCLQPYEPDVIKYINLERLTDLVKDCRDDNDRKNLLKAIDLINKTANIYQQTVKVSNEEYKLDIGEGL